MYIQNGGNIGIGSVAPAGLLDVESTVAKNVFFGGVESGVVNVGIGTTTPQGSLVVMNGNVGIGTWVPNSTLNVNGSVSVTVVSKLNNYTATANDHVILVSASSGAVTITLPAAASVTGREYIIKKTDSSSNLVTISDSTASFDGQPNSVAISIQYQSYTIVSDGTNWDIV